MLIVFLVIFAKSGNQIRIIGLVGGKVKCTAALTAFLHAAVYEMLQILPLVISKQGSQIGVVLFVILIIVNRGVFAGQHIVRLIRRVASEVTRIQGFLIDGLFASVHIDDIRLGHGNVVDRAVVPKAIPFHCCIVNCILEFVICQISSGIQLTQRLGMVDHRQN